MKSIALYICKLSIKLEKMDEDLASFNVDNQQFVITGHYLILTALELSIFPILMFKTTRSNYEGDGAFKV